MPTRNLNILVIGPDKERRQEIVAELLHHRVAAPIELEAYSQIRNLAAGAKDWNVALLDLDSDPDLCLAVVQTLSSRNPMGTVMVYAKHRDPELLMRCMRAGAREYLTLPIDHRLLQEALSRAAARRTESAGLENTGKILVFLGSKGGVGVSTIATNFAVVLNQEGASAFLLDLNLELGETSLLLGVNPQFTLADVLENARRLDRELLEGMITRHDSGLALIPGPDAVGAVQAFENGDLSRLLGLLQDQFSFIVVDAGHGLLRNGQAFLDMADTVYVVTQADVPALRNAQRYVKHLQRVAGAKVRLVLNRYDVRKPEIDEDHIAKAVGAPVDWRLPSDYQLVRRSHNTAAPLALADSPISLVIRNMAREVCGKPLQPAPKRRLRFLG
ncbi:MAG: hypothetical protein K6T61_13185 [Bryobacteraceae bacterium]|nr:hypothetical protein [Bryobacteraceae bacterium]